MTATTTNSNETGPWEYRCQIFYKEAKEAEVIVEFTADRKTNKPKKLKSAKLQLPDGKTITQWKFWGNNKSSDHLHLTPVKNTLYEEDRVLGVFLDFRAPSDRKRPRQITYLELSAEDSKIEEHSGAYVSCTRQ